MLQIKKLNLIHKKDLKIILDNFNLVLNAGDKVVIIGEEGNGKSTLMKWIYDPALVENYMEAQGERIIGQEKLGYLPQQMSDEIRKKASMSIFRKKKYFGIKHRKSYLQLQESSK